MKSKDKDEILEFSSEESQSEDDEDGRMLTEEVEKEFYNTLSKIKNRDPKIYEKDTEFFKDLQTPENVTEKKSKTKPLTVENYERTMVAKRGAVWSDEDSDVDNNREGSSGTHLEPTYVQEQEELKKSFEKFVCPSSEDEEDKDGGLMVGLLRKREKTADEKISQEENNVKKWLEKERKRQESVDESEPEPELDKEDQFLRDYVLNKRFLDKNDEDDVPDISAVEFVAEDKCDHRFEERDEEFIKRYPRTMENSLRRKNESRKKKRDEVKERKLKEKEKKRVELKIKKKLKKEEIEKELQNLKKLTGNDQIESVLDFDIDEYDKAMQRLFNDEFYSQEDANFKPDSTSDDQVNWNDGDGYIVTEETEEYNNIDQQEYASNGNIEGYEGVDDDNEDLNCEDPNFNMDCDYDPTLVKPKDMNSRSRRRKDKHRRTTVSEAVSREKPLFDPTVHKSLQEYMDQYYAIDCEDFIGDLACRFKYRRTVPNSYGLTIEEILTADEKELERWCSIKRIHRRNPVYKEKGDLKVFQKKGADERLKRKILPSLYKTQEEDVKETQVKQKDCHKKCETKTSRTKNVTKESTNELEDLNESRTNSEVTSSKEKPLKTKKKKKKKRKVKETTNTTKPESVPLVGTKRKLESTDIVQRKKKMKINDKIRGCEKSNSKFGKNRVAHKNYENNKNKEHSTLTEMSDARLLAYGIKPKKFRNKLKYS